MSVGYSLRVVTANRNAGAMSLGVRLGRACIAQEIPATTVARRFGVSRQTVYNWFSGVYEPQASLRTAIENYLVTLEG